MFSETLLSTYEFTRSYNPEDESRHFHRRKTSHLEHTALQGANIVRKATVLELL